MKKKYLFSVLFLACFSTHFSWGAPKINFKVDENIKEEISRHFSVSDKQDSQEILTMIEEVSTKFKFEPKLFTVEKDILEQERYEKLFQKCYFILEKTKTDDFLKNKIGKKIQIIQENRERSDKLLEAVKIDIKNEKENTVKETKQKYKILQEAINIIDSVLDKNT